MAEIVDKKRPPAATEADIEAYTIGGARRHDAQIYLADYDAAWPLLFQKELARIRGILGDIAIRVEHVGSTSVPGLAAKPVIDIVMEVPDSGDELMYVEPLEACGYVLRIRERAWFKHRMFKGPDTDINLHVFTVGCPEVDRMLRFRDRLRMSPADRLRYEAKKRELASRQWAYVQNDADAETDIIEEIIAKTSENAR